MIFCVSCPIVWHFKLQTTISLSIEAGHVALPTATRGVICFVNLIQEIQDSGINLPHVSAPKMTCRVLHVPAICQWTSQTCPPTIPDAWLKVPSSSNNFRIPLFLSREERYQIITRNPTHQVKQARNPIVKSWLCSRIMLLGCRSLDPRCTIFCIART